jgi:hypothetical protein
MHGLGKCIYYDICFNVVLAFIDKSSNNMVYVTSEMLIFVFYYKSDNFINAIKHLAVVSCR